MNSSVARAEPAPDEPPAEIDGAVPPEKLGLLTSLHLYPDYRQLWISTVLTQIGQWMLQVTLGWVVLNLTDSAGYVGLIGFASGIPFILVSIPAGVIIDRFDRRQVLIVCQAAAAVISLGLAILVSLGHVQPWQLLLGAFLNGSALAINNATRQTMVPAFVKREHLQNAIAVMSAGQNSTRILGPSLGGPAIALMGAAGALYLQTGFLVAAMISTLLLPSVRASVRSLSMRRNLAEGLSFVARSPILTGLIVMAAIPSLLIFPYVQLLPVFARDILKIGAGGLGLLLSAGGTGAVVGSLAVAGTVKLSRQGLIMLMGTFVYVFVVVAFAFSSWVILTRRLALLLWISGVILHVVEQHVVARPLDGRDARPRDGGLHAHLGALDNRSFADGVRGGSDRCAGGSRRRRCAHGFGSGLGRVSLARAANHLSATYRYDRCPRASTTADHWPGTTPPLLHPPIRRFW